MHSSIRPRVALIEEDLGLLRMLEVYLDTEDFEVLTHPDAESAADWVSAERPAVVVIDLHLQQRAAGWQILRELKQQPETASIPVVIATGDRNATRNPPPEVAGLDYDVLLKPYGPDELASRLRRLVRR